MYNQTMKESQVILQGREKVSHNPLIFRDKWNWFHRSKTRTSTGK